MCVILIVYYELCLLFCNFVRPQFAARFLSQCTIATLFDDFTDEVMLTDEVSTVRFVVARLYPLKEYRVPIVGMPRDVNLCQESQPVWLSGNLALN